MKVSETSLSGCLIIEPTVYEDHRGFFFEGFNAKNFEKETGIDFRVEQMNCSRSSRGVIRGLHFQEKPYEQAKLIFVTRGEVLDVAVDLRKDSPTYGKHVKVMLSNENQKRIFIPKGFAHGFLSMTEDAELNYLVDEVYNAEYDSGIHYADADLSIDWEISEQNTILSEKDRKLQSFKNYV
ncbi:MAG: dTDP-4-dehydrorhamnose 3,5-epimerase, partial [Cyclobacteriaceae bacterium]